MMVKMTDCIIYTLVTEPGGQDGMDRNDKGGKTIAASFVKEVAVNLGYPALMFMEGI